MYVNDECVCVLMLECAGDAVGCNAPSTCSLRLDGPMLKEL